MGVDNLRFEQTLPLPILNEFTYLKWLYSYLVLPFNMQAQTQSNWCWAATSTSVSRYYSAFSPWTQCKVASDELGQTCCTPPVPGACNVPWYLDRALTRTNNFVSIQSGTVTWNTVKSELEKGLVVGTRIGWNGGGGHFMVLHGVSSIGITNYLHIDDPIYGKSVLTYQQFATNYQGSGSWTHTYFTKKYFYFMWFRDLVFNPVLLRPIPEIRPLLQAYDPSLAPEAMAGGGDFGIPHHVYQVPLNAVAKDGKLPAAPAALRVLEMKNDAPVAFYDLSLDEEHPELLQMNRDPAYFTLMDAALGRLKGASGERKSMGELSLIRIPGLNMEALRLEFGGRTKSLISILPRFQYETFDTDKVYEEEDFLKLLRKAAARMQQDDTMGA
jgi:Papain-like cysteine protease AvrRpt2